MGMNIPNSTKVEKGMMNIMNDDMLILGDLRIPASRVKEYGIKEENVYYEKIYIEKVTKGFLSKTYSYEWHGEKKLIGHRLCRADKDFFHFHEEGAREGDKLGTNWSKRVNREHIVVERDKCFYLKTYQDEVYECWQSKQSDGMDVEECCKKLDEWFNKQNEN